MKREKRYWLRITEWIFNMGRIWNLEAYAGQTALVDELYGNLDYRQLWEAGDQLAEAAGGRCLVFCLCRNSAGLVLGYTAFLNHAIVPVMLPGSMEQEAVLRLVEIYRPQYLWLPLERKADFTRMDEVHESYGYMLVKTGCERTYGLHEDLALLLTTSGSTGSPRFVRQSYENIRANTGSIVQYLELDHTERPVTTLPINYTYGLSVLNTHLYAGATVLLTDKSVVDKDFWRFFLEQKATSFGGVPYTYEMLEKLRMTRMELPSLRTMTQAGGKLDGRLHEMFARYAADTGRKFVVMYGQCEATARMGYLPPEKAVEKKGSMGIAIPGGKFRLMDGDGREITTPYVTGELVYEGPNVTPGYAQCAEDLGRGDERGGVLYTGDMARFDEDGYYYITGRKKRFLKLYGNRVSLDEVEQMIRERFRVQAACAGVDDHLYLFLAGASGEAEIRSYIIQKTGLNPAAFRTVALEQIPKNEAGKILYRELEQYYRQK